MARASWLIASSLLMALENKNYTQYNKMPTKKESIRTIGFTSKITLANNNDQFFTLTANNIRSQLKNVTKNPKANRTVHK